MRKSKIYFGNATDIYMPIEQTLRLVPPILEFFLAHPPRELEVQTRGPSRAVARDIPLLQALAQKTRVLVSYSIHTEREEVRRLFEPKAPSLGERERGLRLYYEAGIATRLSCMPILPLNPDAYAERFAPLVTQRVWVAAMNHKQLTVELFRRHFPAWLDARHVEGVMRQTVAAFAARGVKGFYRSLTPAATRARWERRAAGQRACHAGSFSKGTEKTPEVAESQPSLFGGDEQR